jgi:hypothetical protein
MDKYKKIVNADAIYLDTCVFVKIDAKEEMGSNFSRALIYFSKIPIYSSFVSFGEFISVVTKKAFQKTAGTDGFLFVVRQLMIDFDMNKIKRIEPIEDKFDFIQLSQTLSEKYSSLGGGDLWHIMAALNLKNQIPNMVFVSFDTKLVKAANTQGLSAIDGNGLDPNQFSEELQNADKFIGK